MDTDFKGLIDRATDSPQSLSDEAAWIEVIQRMDNIYADIVRYQVELEEKNAVLEDAQQFIQSVLSSITHVLIVADTQGVIQQVNHAFEQLTGKTANEIVGEPLGVLFTEEYAPMVEDFSEHIRTGVITDCDVELRGIDDEPAPIAINCTPRFDHNGRLSGLVITGRPMGELRRAYQELKETHDQLKATQKQLVQSEKMASLGQLVAGVAHELNNPISFVFGNMHALKRYGQRLADYLNAIHGGVPDFERDSMRKELKIDRLLQDIGPLIDGSLEGAERVGEIVDDLRRFSTPNQQSCQQFDLAKVVNTAADWVIKARRERPTVNIDMPDELALVGYEGYVHQILVNLIQNAADAVEGDKNGNIDVGVATTGDRVRIQVSDNGTGIEPEKLLRVFDPFFTTKPVGKGTGLGLCISYNLATEQCLGHLQAANRDDEGGAVFTLELPMEISE